MPSLPIQPPQLHLRLLSTSPLHLVGSDREDERILSNWNDRHVGHWADADTDTGQLLDIAGLD